jgi:RNA polymerase sigma factor (sigma-70 family)
MESPNLTEHLMRSPRLQDVISDRAFSIGETVALGDSEVGNERALQLLYQRRSQEMFGFARRLGLADEDASDAVQETMLRMWRELDSGTDVVDPDAWAFRVLYRLAVDNHRLRGRLRGLAERLRAPRPAGDPGRLDGDPARRIEVDAVWQAIDRLPERQRAVLYLRFRADLPYERIGLALSISAGAARGHASTGLASLRRRLTQEDRP